MHGNGINQKLVCWGTLRRNAPRSPDGSGGAPLDYFTLTPDPGFEVIGTAFTKRFGEAPGLLRVMLASSTIRAGLESWMEEWNVAGMVHRCNGVQQTAYRHQNKLVKGSTKCAAPQCKCQQVLRIALVLPDLVMEVRSFGYVVLVLPEESDIAGITASITENARYLAEGESLDVSGVSWFISVRSEADPTCKDGHGLGTKSETHQTVRMAPDPAWVALRTRHFASLVTFEGSNLIQRTEPVQPCVERPPNSTTPPAAAPTTKQSQAAPSETPAAGDTNRAERATPMSSPSPASARPPLQITDIWPDGTATVYPNTKADMIMRWAFWAGKLRIRGTDEAAIRKEYSAGDLKETGYVAELLRQSGRMAEVVRKWDEEWRGRTVSDWYTRQPVLPQAVLCDLCAAAPEAVLEAFQAKKWMEDPLKSMSISAIREVMRNSKAGETNATQTSDEAAA